MPFVSKAQRRWMHATRPAMAAEWEAHTPKGKKLPSRLRKGSIDKKASSLGGPGNDTSFEQAFSQLAHSVVAEKAPTLMDYELGFQLLDRSPDDDHAAGIMGFKIGEQVLYVPLFFIKGEIKGHELLYLKEQDVFVPLKENWINRLMARKPQGMAEPVTRSNSQLGIRQPNLMLMSRPMAAKYASTIHPELLPGVIGLAKAATSPIIFPDLDLEGVIKEGGVKYAKLLAAYCLQFPKLASAFAEHYDLGRILNESLDREQMRPAGVMAGSIKLAGVMSFEAAAEPKIRVLRRSDRTALRTVTDEMRERVHRDGFAILDKRADIDVSIPYKVQIDKSMTNPTGSGIFDVLAKPGRWTRCVVIMNPWTNRGRGANCIVIPLEDAKDDGEKDYISGSAAKVWIKQPQSNTSVGQENPEEYREWVDSLSDEISASGDKRPGLYVIFDENGNASSAFEPESFIASDKPGRALYRVHFNTCACGGNGRPKSYPPMAREDEDGDNSRRSYGDQFLQTTNLPLGNMHSDGRYLMVPKGFRVLTLRPPGKSYVYELSEKPAVEKLDFELGNKVDVREMIFNKTAALNITNIKGAVYINNEKSTEAVVDLVVRHGLREDDARAVLAAAKKSGEVSYRVKQADIYHDLVRNAPTMPSMPDQQFGGYDGFTSLAQTTSPEQYNIPTGYPPPPPDQPDITQPPQPDHNAAQGMAQASQSGSKNLLDASALGGLLKSDREDSMIDKFLPRLRASVDAVGRMIFSLYQHGDKWSDRFGQSDMPAIEDSLRNSFENDGDLILELETKQVDSIPGQDTFTDIEDAA